MASLHRLEPVEAGSAKRTKFPKRFLYVIPLLTE